MTYCSTCWSDHAPLHAIEVSIVKLCSSESNEGFQALSSSLSVRLLLSILCEGLTQSALVFYGACYGQSQIRLSGRSERPCSRLEKTVHFRLRATLREQREAYKCSGTALQPGCARL